MSEAITQAATETARGLKTILDNPGLLWLDLDDPMSHVLDELATRYKKWL